MRLERYEAVADFRHEVYEFESIGPKGTISKTIIFDRITSDLYNLSFEDWDSRFKRRL